MQFYLPTSLAEMVTVLHRQPFPFGCAVWHFHAASSPATRPHGGLPKPPLGAAMVPVSRRTCDAPPAATGTLGIRGTPSA